MGGRIRYRLRTAGICRGRVATRLWGRRGISRWRLRASGVRRRRIRAGLRSGCGRAILTCRRVRGGRIPGRRRGGHGTSGRTRRIPIIPLRPHRLGRRSLIIAGARSRHRRETVIGRCRIGIEAVGPGLLLLGGAGIVKTGLRLTTACQDRADDRHQEESIVHRKAPRPTHPPPRTLRCGLYACQAGTRRGLARTAAQGFPKMDRPDSSPGYKAFKSKGL